MRDKARLLYRNTGPAGFGVPPEPPGLAVPAAPYDPLSGEWNRRLVMLQSFLKCLLVASVVALSSTHVTAGSKNDPTKLSKGPPVGRANGVATSPQIRRQTFSNRIPDKMVQGGGIVVGRSKPTGKPGATFVPPISGGILETSQGFNPQSPAGTGSPLGGGGGRTPAQIR
jgi:hypothetical protein